MSIVTNTLLMIVFVVGLLFSASAQASSLDPDKDLCLPTWPHKTAESYLAEISNGWRPLDTEAGPGKVNELRNAEIILAEFRKAGFSNAIAYAAIVNAMEESALNHRAIMSSPFRYKDKYYPHGTRAVGLFQLLPSVSGAGGPSGKEEGYTSNFMQRRYAGTRTQAHKHNNEPDYLGRTYYNGQNPIVNTRRIILEVKRDGAALLAADKRGSSIAVLSYLFGRDIERPSGNVWKRRYKAAKMYGHRFAYDDNPNDMFPLEFKVPEPPYEPPGYCDQVFEPTPQRSHLAAMLPMGLFGLVLFGLARKRDSAVGG
jgi:hypothetical protein